MASRARTRAKRVGGRDSGGPRDIAHDEDPRELLRAIEALHALLADLDAYLDAAHRVLPEVGRVETDEGRRQFGFLYKYLDDAHALGRRAVAEVKRLAELAIVSERGPSPRVAPGTLGKLKAVERRARRALRQARSAQR